MSFLERLGGGGGRPRKEPEPEAVPAPEAPTTSSGLSANELLRDAAPGAAGALGAGPPGRLYDPYDGISSAIGGKKMVFQLPEAPEFVFQEEATVRRRGWGESLQFYTGLGYLGGGATGFAVGGYKYARLPPEPALDSMKLKANRLINTSGSLGRQFACGAAVLGLYFASAESYLHYLVDGRAPDSAVTTAAGFMTAALYRAPRGPRAASVAGAVGALFAAGLAALRQRYPSL